MKTRPKHSTTGLLARKIGLGTAVLAGLLLYFIFRNTPQQQAEWIAQFTLILGAAYDVAQVGLLLAVSGGIGQRAADLLRLPPDALSRAETVALQAALGLGLLSIGALVFGLIGAYSAIMWLALLIVGAVHLPAVIGWLRDLRGALRVGLAAETGMQRLMLGVSLLLLILALPLALAAPFHWDAVVYHLELPARYLDAGRIITTPDIHFGGFPQGVEVLYGLLMSTGRDTAPALLHFAYGALALLATAGLLHRHVNRIAAYIGAALLLLNFSLWKAFGIPYVDLALMAYGAVILSALLAWDEDRHPRWLILLGLLGGLALGVKYTAAPLLIGIGVFVALRAPRRVLVNGLICGGTALLIFVPWLVKGLLLYDNPIYPYIFGGPGWDDFKAVNFNRTDAGLLTTAPLEWALLPLAAALRGIENVAPYGFTMHPWLLGLPLLLPLVWAHLDDPRRRFARSVTLFGVPLLLFWYALAAFSGIGPQPRLMLGGAPTAAILAVLTLHGLGAMPRRPLDVTFIVRAVIVLSAPLLLLDMLHSVTRSQVGPYFAAQIDRDAYLTANLGLHYGAMLALDDLPAGSTVRLMWDPKVYYCPDHITCIPDGHYDHWAATQILEGLSPDEVFARWYDGATDYLLVAGLQPDSGTGYDLWLTVGGFAEDENALFPAALDRWMTPVWSDGRWYDLFAFRQDSPDFTAN